MEHRQVEGIDAYGFPADLLGHPTLRWMGDDYVQFITVELLKQFRRQDPSTRMLSIQCEERPNVLTRIEEPSGIVRGAVVTLKLQVVLRDSNDSSWRLRGDCTFQVSGLEVPATASVTIGFDIRSTEQVGATAAAGRSAAQTLLAAYMNELRKGTDTLDLKRATAELIAIGKSSGPAEAAAALVGIAGSIPALELDAAGHASIVAGALVEGGGDPLIAVGPILERLREALPFVEELSRAVEERAGDNELTPELQQAVARDHPHAARAMSGFHGLQMGAIAHLSRSKRARAMARALPGLFDLAGSCAPSHFISNMLAVLDDEDVFVLVPSVSKGFVVTISGVAEIAQLQVLLADILIGSGHLPGTPPAALVVAVANGSGPQESRDTLEGWWDMYGAGALRPDRSLPRDPTEAPEEQVVWNEGVPADIPVESGRRTVLLAPASYVRTWQSQRLFASLAAQVILKRVMSTPEVQQLLADLASCHATA